MRAYIISDSVERQSRDEKIHIVTKDVVGLILGEVGSILKKHFRKGCGWLPCRRGSKYEKKHILTKDVVY